LLKPGEATTAPPDPQSI